MKLIKDFLSNKAKDIPLANLLYILINNWEQDRGAMECESVFDLYNREDFKMWVDMYGIESAINCYKKTRFWLGGSNYAVDETEKAEGISCGVVCPLNINEQELNWILGEIEDTTRTNHTNGFTYKQCEQMYGGFVKLEEYFRQTENTDIEEYIRDVFSPCGDFDMVDMDIELSEEVNTKEGNHIDFYWVNCSENGKPCDLGYSCIKFNGVIYLPSGARDAYPCELGDIHNYRWVNKDNDAFNMLYFDKHYNIIGEDELKHMWAVSDMLGEDYLPNFLNKNNSLDDMRDEIIQEFTLCLYDRYKDHIDARDLFLQYCKDCAIHFISLYKHTDFSEENCSYYDYVDHYIDVLCPPNMVKAKCWYSKF